MEPHSYDDEGAGRVPFLCGLENSTDTHPAPEIRWNLVPPVDEGCVGGGRTVPNAPLCRGAVVDNWVEGQRKESVYVF